MVINISKFKASKEKIQIGADNLSSLTSVGSLILMLELVFLDRIG
jgi:hypothetical protein